MTIRHSSDLLTLATLIALLLPAAAVAQDQSGQQPPPGTEQPGRQTQPDRRPELEQQPSAAPETQPDQQTLEEIERTAERALAPADYYRNQIESFELLTLSEAIQTALSKNVQVRVQELRREESRLQLEAFKYRFRPAYTIGSTISHSERGGATSVQFNFGISRSDRLNNFFEISKQTRSGGTFTLRQELNKTKIGATGEGDNPVAGVPTFEGVTSLTYNRPLFRDSGEYVNKIDKLVSRNQLDLAETTLELTRMDTVQQAITQYLNLIQAQETIRVRESSLRRAQELLRRNIARYRVGLGLRSDVLEAENSVLSQRSALEDSITAYRTAKREFLDTLGVERGIQFRVDPEVRDRITEVEGDTENLVGQAFEFDSQLADLKTQKENAALQRDRLENQLEPDIDLTASVSRQGEDFHELGGFEEERFTSYQVGVEWNFGGTEAATKNELQSNRKQRRRLSTQISDRRNRLRNRVRSLRDEIDGLESRLEAARANVRAARERFELTSARVDAGLATTFDQVRAEEELLTARLERLQAEVTLNQRRQELSRLVGRTYSEVLAGPDGGNSAATETQTGAERVEEAPEEDADGAGGGSQ